MWNTHQATQEMLSFDWTVHSGVGVGKPCYCGILYPKYYSGTALHESPA